MEFETQRIFHIYNRGNNSEKVFFNRENYLFFLGKIKKYILPYGNILAWCLLPNHFHIMVEVLKVDIPIIQGESQGLTQSETLTKPHLLNRSLNDSLGIMLRSYTRAINKEQQRSGSLFQKKTKSKCLNDPEFSPAYFNTAFGMLGNTDIEGADYQASCFRYIHNNPVHHKLAVKASDWEFSSYLDLFGDRSGHLVNKQRVAELDLLRYQ